MEKVGSLSHLFVTLFLGAFSNFVVMPALTDVTMEALCPGKDECSLAIYLSGFQQAVTGIGSVVMTPLIGNLSDVYGRKTLLTLPLTLSILPLVVLAYSRGRNFFYAYYALKTVASMISEGTINCLSLAYIADIISEGKRASAFGVMAGVGSAAFVCGTITARFLPTAQTFQAAAFSAMAAAAYMRIFLKETTREVVVSTQPLLKSETSSSSDGNPSNQYILKAQFHFSKNQFADLMLIVGIAGMVSQMILNSIAWDPWMRSIASKQVGGCEQGKAQGCISAISSLANIISPLVFSPLTGHSSRSKPNDKGIATDTR
ncbi:Hippocampus abundant transcript 1 protein [Bienertia sinuspersici]